MSGAAPTTPRLRASRSRCVEVGLVNNMPDAALEATERQFRSLLASAASGIDVRLTIYSLPGVPRSDAGRRVASQYSSIGDLWNHGADGLIVTGTEPKEKDLAKEPYWSDLTQLLAWAEEETASTVWSCLAAPFRC